MSRQLNYLLSVVVRLPESDTVLLGNISALGQHLGVRNHLLPSLAHLLHKVVGAKLGVGVLLGLHTHGALGVGVNLNIEKI